MKIDEYAMPAILKFRKETTNEGKVIYLVRVKAVDNDGSRYMLDVTQCEAVQRLLPVFEEGLKRRGY